MNIGDFIGRDSIHSVPPDNIWLTHPILDPSICKEYDFDASFFDNKQRVENKYKSIPEFDQFYRMSLEELSAILDPPTNGVRRVILGTTEHLFPYVAYCLHFINKHRVGIESGQIALPFIFFAPAEWSLTANIDFIDCLSHYYASNKYTINVFLSKDKTSWLTPEGQPRIAIYELIRLYTNLGDIRVIVENDTYHPNVYKVIINNTLGGGRKKYKRKSRRKYKNKRKRSYKKSKR